MRPRRRAAIGMAMVLLGAACSGTGARSDGPDIREDVTGTISFLVFGEPEELRAFRNVAAAFAGVERDVTVVLIEASDRDDLLARLSTSISAGDPPDLFLVNYRFYAQFAARGVIEPVAPYLETSDVFSEADFYPVALDAFRFGGTLTCLPQNVSSLVVYVNEDRFAEANVAVPRTGWRWTDMVNAARLLTHDEDGDGFTDVFGVGVDPEIIRLAPFVWSNGGEVVDDPVRPTRFTLDTARAVEVIQSFSSLVEPFGVAPNELEVESQDLETRFLNGTLAMFLSSRRETPSFRTITDFEWDVAPLPVFEEPAGILHSDAYCMAGDGENRAAAWRFMEFALGPEGQRITAATGRTVPSLIEVATSRAFLDPSQEPENSRVFLDTIDVIRRIPSISTWPEIEDRANAILEQAMYGDLAPGEAARRLVEETRVMFARAEG